MTMPKPMSIQQAFDKSARHLLKQNERSVRGGENPNNFEAYCAYRSPTGLKCAIGCHIPDTMYKSDMDESEDGTEIELILDFFPEIESLYDFKNEDYCDYIDFLNRLQKIHDQHLPIQWVDKLGKLASFFDLKPDVIYK